MSWGTPNPYLYISLSIIYTLYTALCVICYALTTKLLSRIEVHGEKRLSAWPLGLEIHITRCEKNMLWDPRDQLSLLRSWYNITIIYSHIWITYMNSSHDNHNSHNDNTNTRLNIVWQGATWQRTALMIAARHGDSDHRTIGTHGVSAATQVPCSKIGLCAKLGDGFQCSPFSLGSIARKKIQDSQNGMNPGQDDVVIRALETSCTQPQLDVWASQMGPGCFGAIPLKAPKATWLWTVQRDFKWLWQMILPDKSGILMIFFWDFGGEAGYTVTGHLSRALPLIWTFSFIYQNLRT